MAEQVGSIYWQLDLDDKKFYQGLDRASESTNVLTNTFHKAEQASFAMLAALTGLTTAAAAFGIQSIKNAANLETMRAGFVTLLGSTEEANKAIELIKKDAASTPFELPGLIQANQLLTSITKDAQRSEDFLLNIGKALTAMGKGQPELDRIIVNLQQIGAVGKASMMDIRQFAFAGIPIFEMLKEETGLAGDALEQYISDGKVSFEVLEGLFNKAGGAAGRFGKAFETQAGTFNQLLSNAMDNLNIFGVTLVEQSGLFDFAKDALKAFNDAIGQLTLNIEAAGGPAAYLNQVLTENHDAVILISGAIIGSLVPAFVSLGISIGGALLPLLPFIAIGAGIAILVDKIVTALGGWDIVNARISEGLQKIRDVVEPILTPALEQLRQVWEEQLLPALQKFWAEHGPTILKLLKELAPIVGGVLVVAVLALVLGLTGLVQAASEVIKVVSVLLGKVGEFGETIGGLVARIQNIPAAIGIALGGVFNGIVEPFRRAFEWVKQNVQPVIDSLNNLNPFMRHSPSLVDWITRGTDEIVNQYSDMFNKLDDMSVDNRVALTGTAQSMSESLGNDGGTLAQGAINISLNPNGIIARSPGELTDISMDILAHINAALKSKGRAPLGGNNLLQS